MRKNILRGLYFILLIIISLSGIFVLTSCSRHESPVQPSTADRSVGGPETQDLSLPATAPECAPGEVLVVLKEKKTESELRLYLTEYGLSAIEVINVEWGPLYRLRIDGIDSVKSMVDRLNRDDRVKYAEPNWTCKLDDAPSVPNDPMWERDDAGDDPRDSVFDQWGPAKSGAPIVWNETNGTHDTVVAVLDTGIRYTHEDLLNQVWYNEDEISGNGIDDDNNGWIDDWNGWNFNNDNNDIYDTAYTSYYHGTACSGIVAAEQDNDRGVSGIAPGVKVMGVKLNLSAWPESMFISSVVKGLNYAKINEADIVSMSFGTTNFSQSMKDACDAAYDNGNGMVLMASAGNANNTDFHYPSGYSSVIAVAAVCAFNDDNSRAAEQRISPSMGFSWGSSYGDQLEISGYGDKYTTTYGQHYDSYWDGVDDFFFGGTSCACPMTAGVMALLKTYYPDQPASWLRTRIEETADDIHGVGWDNQSGYGRVNAVRALYGSDRYTDQEDANGFIHASLPEARYHDCIHDVSGNPYLDSEDLFTFETPGGGTLSISCYIYNWGENLDLALYSDRKMTDLVAESVINNNPNNNIESIQINADAVRRYYLKVYSPAEGNSSLYDLTISNQPSFNLVGTDIAPGTLPSGGSAVPFLKLECTSSDFATLNRLNVNVLGTLSLGNIGAVELYEDTSGDGDFGPGDSLILSTGTPSMNRIKMNGLSLQITSATPRTFFVTCDVVPDINPATLQLSLQSYKDAQTLEGYQAPYENFPINSSLTIIGE
ncbi:MAG: S8 family serine peptidase [bacterium]